MTNLGVAEASVGRELKAVFVAGISHLDVQLRRAKEEATLRYLAWERSDSSLAHSRTLAHRRPVPRSDYMYRNPGPSAELQGLAHAAPFRATVSPWPPPSAPHETAAAKPSYKARLPRQSSSSPDGAPASSARSRKCFPA